MAGERLMAILQGSAAWAEMRPDLIRIVGLLRIYATLRASPIVSSTARIPTFSTISAAIGARSKRCMPIASTQLRDYSHDPNTGVPASPRREGSVMTASRLYPGQWVAVAGTREVGYLVRHETHFGDSGWYVSLRDGWEAWVRVGDLTPWQPERQTAGASR